MERDTHQTTFQNYSPYHRRIYVQDENRVDVHGVINCFLAALEELENRRKGSLEITNKGEAERIKDLMNIPGVHSQVLLPLQTKGFEWQEYDFLPSNLGRGYIFYFLCAGCDKRAKYLYRSRFDSQRLMCWRCCHLIYQYKRGKRLGRLYKTFNKRKINGKIMSDKADYLPPVRSLTT